MSNREVLFRFVLDKAESAPTSNRAAIYRALAEFAGDPKQTRELKSLAEDLEQAEFRCREFAFRFSGGAKEEAGS